MPPPPESFLLCSEVVSLCYFYLPKQSKSSHHPTHRIIAVHELSLRWQSQNRFWEQEIHPTNWTGVQYCLTYSWCRSLLCTIKVRLALFSSCFFIFSSSVRFLLAVLTPLKLPPWIKSWATSINALPNNPQSDTTSELHASHLLNFNIPKQSMPLSQVSPLHWD